MTDYQILKNILYGAEVTIESNKAWLDRYKTSYNEIDFDFAMMLFQIKIIDVDSGNFETGETHYFLDDKFVKVDNKIRHISIKKIDEQLKKIIGYNVFPTFVRLSKAFESIKNNEARKQKLKKLNEGR
jgi:hypothetical protein